MSPIPLYLLAGGQSSRFGTDKALAMIDGQPMITRVAAQWAPHASRIVVVADRPGKYDACGLPTIADNQPNLGPIGGLLTALEHCREGWLLLAACDVFVLDAELPRRLLSEIGSENVQAIAFKGTHWETMPALYHCTLLPVVRARLAEGPRSLWQIIEQVLHVAIPYSPKPALLAQINTPEDLRKFTGLRS